MKTLRCGSVERVGLQNGGDPSKGRQGRTNARLAAVLLALTLLAGNPGAGLAAPVRDPQGYADALKSELSNYAKNGPSRGLTALLQLGQQFIKDPQALPAFRAAIDVDVASHIVLAAASSDRALRIAAALLLVDLVDNRTMCAVADALMQDGLDADARFNFLQILRIANRYAMAENRAWNGRAIEAAKAFVSSNGSRGDFSKTLDLVERLEEEQEKFASSANLLILGREQPASFQACRGLPNIARLAAENAPYEVYLHSRRPPKEIDAAKAGLEGLGFTVRGVDAQVDQVGGFGIDYAIASQEPAETRDRTRARADEIGDVFAATLGAKLPRRPQTQAPQGAFGIWF